MTLKWVFSLSVPNVKPKPKANSRFSPLHKAKPNSGIDQIIVLRWFLFWKVHIKIKIQGLKQNSIVPKQFYKAKIEIQWKGHI